MAAVLLDSGAEYMGYACDVTRTCADVSKLKALTGYAPVIPIEVGLPKFVEWYRGYYRV